MTKMMKSSLSPENPMDHRAKPVKLEMTRSRIAPPVGVLVYARELLAPVDSPKYGGILPRSLLRS
jgi:hypothetical protein